MDQPIPDRKQGASTRAITVLIFGILSLVCLGFLGGIPAIVLGSVELKAIKRGEAPATGEGIAKAGFILGIIGTTLSCLTTLVAIILALLGISFGSTEMVQHFFHSV